MKAPGVHQLPASLAGRSLKSKYIWRYCSFIPLLQQSLHLPIKTSWALLMGSNMGEACQTYKAWSEPEHFCQLSSGQKSGKSTEVESTEKYTTLCILMPWMAHCTGLKCENMALHTHNPQQSMLLRKCSFHYASPCLSANPKSLCL